MLLRDLLAEIYSQLIPSASQAWKIHSISTDSRQVLPDSVFVALKGPAYNGAEFIQEAVKKGARVIVTTENINPSSYKNNLIIRVLDPDVFLRKIVRRFYGDLSQVRAIGITGTNGKTTITYLLESIIHANQQRCGVMGTINYRVGQKKIPSKNTTPGLIENQIFLSELSKEKIDYCVMEVSSHALVQGRVDLVDFKTAVFTNLTSDHLDYHKTREDYFLAKAKLFINLLSGSTAVINLDDEYASQLISLTKSKILTYGIKKDAQFLAHDIDLKISGTTFTIKSPKGEIKIKSPLVGLYNVYNILSAVGAAISNEIPVESIQKGIEQLIVVPGRLERVNAARNFSVFIDYAHTEDALKNVLQTVKNLCSSRLIVVFGCGGDRDRTKRPKMGKVASNLADICIVTSDNPRSENPSLIIQEIVAGMEGEDFTVIEDRTQAIHHALEIARGNDVIIIAGKGHETYQIFKDRTIDFDERAIVEEYLLSHRK